MKEVVDIKKSRTKYLIVLIGFVFIFPYCGKAYISRNKNNIDIYNVVKEAFITDKGFSNELSKHMSEEVFEKTNIYKAYAVDNPEYRKPLKIDFSLKENSQQVKKDVIYVEMTYSIEITDSQGKTVGGSWDVPITFTVKKVEDGWYIVDKDESA